VSVNKNNTCLCFEIMIQEEVTAYRL